MGSTDLPKDSEENAADRSSVAADESGVVAGGSEPEAGTAAERGGDSGFSGQFRRQRTALLVLGVIGAMVLGFAIGVLARQPLDGDSGPSPSAVDIGFSQDM